MPSGHSSSTHSSSSSSSSSSYSDYSSYNSSSDYSSSSSSSSRSYSSYDGGSSLSWQEILLIIVSILLGILIVLIVIDKISYHIKKNKEQSQQTITEPSYAESYSSSYEENYGSIIYLHKENGVAEIVFNESDANLILEKDSNDNYYDPETDVYIYRNIDVVNGGIWQYWWEGFSNNYPDYGWMEYDENKKSWYIETSQGNWKVTEGKDYFWYIKENNSNY